MRVAPAFSFRIGERGLDGGAQGRGTGGPADAEPGPCLHDAGGVVGLVAGVGDADERNAGRQ
jgi:hypothetical protein